MERCTDRSCLPNRTLTVRGSSAIVTVFALEKILVLDATKISIPDNLIGEVSLTIRRKRGTMFHQAGISRDEELPIPSGVEGRIGWVSVSTRTLISVRLLDRFCSRDQVDPLENTWLGSVSGGVDRGSA